MTSRNYEPPPASLLALESLSLAEYATFVSVAPFIVSRRRGEDHPVLVLPGFTASDRTTKPLRSVLRRKGYSVHGWGLGPNVGPHPHVLAGLNARVAELHRRYGSRVSLVGWSLGGIYARELARARPELIHVVITMGSPYRFRAGDRGSASKLYDVVGPPQDPYRDRTLGEEDRPPITVPTTSIYTRTDGIVHWTACIDAAGPNRENIEVIGTHYGLGYNVGALIAIMDRLDQPQGSWQPFRPPVGTHHLFPRPAVWWPKAQQPRPAGV
jgi:pimeloyl-ACP methyl ester carboxylesterase